LTVGVAGNLPALGFLAAAIVYLLNVTADVGSLIVVLVCVFVVLALAVIGFARHDYFRPLIRLDAIYAALCALAYPALLLLDPGKPLELIWLAIPALVGIPVALAAVAARWDSEL